MSRLIRRKWWSELIENYDPTTSYIYLLDFICARIERWYYLSTSTEIYNTLFRKLLTRYSQIFEEERSFSKFHTSINSSRETNFKSLLSLRREKFFDFFTLLPASEELLSGENLSPFLSNLPFIPALFPPPRPPLIFRACRVNRLLTKFFSSRKKVLVSPPAGEEEKVLPLRPPKLPWQRAENFRKNELSIGEPDKIAGDSRLCGYQRNNFTDRITASV